MPTGNLLRHLIAAICLSFAVTLFAVSQAVASGPEAEVPLFSWWSSDRGDNFATSDPNWSSPITAEMVRSRHVSDGQKKGGYRLFRLEGMIFSPQRPQPIGTVPLYSWWSASREDNFATTNPSWGAGAPASRSGYSRYRLEGYLYDPSAAQPANTIPVYSWWNPERADNFLTSDPDWGNGSAGTAISTTNITRRTKNGYTLYRLEGYAKKASMPAPSTGDVVYRAYVASRHGPDYSRAAVDIESQFSGEAGRRVMNDTGHRFRMHGVNSGGATTHYQGVGFLRDVDVEENGQSQRYRRSVLTYNYEPGLVVSGGRINSASVDGVTAWDSNKLVRFEDKKAFLDIMGERELGNHIHPGGMQSHGDMIAIAMEQPKSGRVATAPPPKNGQPMSAEYRRQLSEIAIYESTLPAAVYFVQVNGLRPHFVTSLKLGSGGAPQGLKINAAAAAGFLKLEKGFLVAVSGASNGMAGVWFYSTAAESISPQAQWQFVDFWTPDVMPGGVCNIDDGKYSNDCHVGGGGGLHLIAGDNGKIYMIATTGTDGRGKDDEYAQLYEVVIRPDLQTNKVSLRTIWTGKKIIGRLAVGLYSMRWAGAAQTTEDGRVILLNSERGQRKQGSVSATDGMLRIAE